MKKFLSGMLVLTFMSLGTFGFGEVNFNNSLAGGNNVTTSYKHLDNPNENRYGIEYSRFLFATVNTDHTVGLSYEYREIEDYENRNAVGVNYSVKF